MLAVRKSALFIVLAFVLSQAHLSAEENPGERDTLISGPHVVRVNKKATKELEYDLCLSIVKSAEKDTVVLLGAKLLEGDECPGVKGSHDREIKPLTRIHQSIEETDKPDTSKAVSIDGKAWQYKFVPLAVYHKTEKGWDGFCASVIVRVDEPTSSGQLIACDNVGTVEKSGERGKFLLCPKVKECHEKKFGLRAPKKVGS